MDTDAVLNSAQERAIDILRRRALSKRDGAIVTIQHVLRMANIPLDQLDDVRRAVQDRARVAVHFHPDRPVSGDRTVAGALIEEGVYRNQFETHISNGGVSAFAGGPRDEWERSLFEGAYHASSAVAAIAADRPKYGALDLVGNSDGPAPRFGCCYFILSQNVTERTTFTFGGSQDAPNHVGAADECDDVLCALFTECFLRDTALGVPNIRAAGLVEKILALDWSSSPPNGPPKHLTNSPSRNLDHYIEAQIQGPIDLGRDVAALVIDPSFRGTSTWDELQAMSDRYGFPLYAHPGFQMPAIDVPLDFRGPTMPTLAKLVCTIDGKERPLDACAIGAAVQDLSRNANAPRWAERGTHAEALQELKLLWHVLVRCGKPMGG